MKKIIFISLLILLAKPPVWAASPYVEQLKKVLAAEEAVRKKLNSKLEDALQAANAIKIDLKNEHFDEELSQLLSKVADARNDVSENQLRINFLDDFIHKLDTATITDIKKDAEKILLQLAKKNLLADAETGLENETWTFESHLAKAIRDIMEPNENLGEFVKSYMVYSSLREPRSPRDFLKERKYIGQ